MYSAGLGLGSLASDAPGARAMSAVFERVREVIEREERAVLFTVVEGEPLGAHLLVLENGEQIGEEALALIGPDHATAVVVLTHDDKFDVPALKAALATEAFYVGALGSRRNQERRRERLLKVGVDEDDVARIHGPCGHDLGAESQP